MAWKTKDEVEQRRQFVQAWQEGRASRSRLCREWGISRPTAYKWIERYEREGDGGLENRSRAPHSHSRSPSLSVQERLLSERRKHPEWGPKKIVAALRAREPEIAWPAPSTAGEMLKAYGLVTPRRYRGRAWPTARTMPCGRNHVWSVDLKGWFRLGNGVRCDPLTILDNYTRYWLCSAALTGAGEKKVREWMERVFRTYGLPEIILSDNGSPFASHGLGGLSRLSVWWIELGIVPERIRPGRPQQNGRLERLHRTLKAEVQAHPMPTRREQQRRLDLFRREYNEERPHEALGQIPPAQVYERSPRDYPVRPPEVEYDDEFDVRRVQVSGEIYWRGYRLFLSEALGRKRVGLRARGEGLWVVQFGPVELALLDEKKRCLLPCQGRRTKPFRMA